MLLLQSTTVKWIEEEIRELKFESVNNLKFNSMFNFANKTRGDIVLQLMQTYLAGKSILSNHPAVTVSTLVNNSSHGTHVSVL